MKTLKLTDAEARILLHALESAGVEAPRLKNRLQSLTAPAFSSQTPGHDASELFDRGRAILESEIEASR